MSEVLTDKDLLKEGLYRYTDDPYNENPFYNILASYIEYKDEHEYTHKVYVGKVYRLKPIKQSTKMGQINNKLKAYDVEGKEVEVKTNKTLEDMVKLAKLIQSKESKTLEDRVYLGNVRKLIRESYFNPKTQVDKDYISSEIQKYKASVDNDKKSGILS